MLVWKIQRVPGRLGRFRKYGSRPFRAGEEGAGGGSTGAGGERDRSKGPAGDRDAKNVSAEYSALRDENEALRGKLKDLDPKIAKLEAAEKDRFEKIAKQEEDRRKKEIGADKMLEEKDTALKSATERLAALEKRERDRVDETFSELPEELREGIASFKDRLPLEEWSSLVSKQEAVAEKLAEKRIVAPGFRTPGGDRGPQGYEPSEKAKEILEDLGKGLDTLKSLAITEQVDEKTRQYGIRVSKQVRSFFKDMNKQPVYRLSTKQ